MKGRPFPKRTAPRPPPAGPRPGQAVRAIAAALLSAVLDSHRPLDAALDADAAFAALAPRDKAFARAIVGVALRRHGTIDAILASLIARRPPRAGAFMRVLEVAAAQILFMETADHAAVSVAVDEIAADRDARHFKGLANAVLRRIARQRDELIAAADTPGSDTPAWLWARWCATYGQTTAERIAAAHRVEPSLDVSVRSDPETWAKDLDGIVLPAGGVRLVPAGPVEALPGYADGQWWVQDAAAALPARLLGDVAGKRVADLCAAPGGKTAELAAAGARVTAVDTSAERMVRLAANLDRLNLSAETVVADILEWRPQEARTAEGRNGNAQGLFDAVLLDAPCTATGTIRRHPDVAWLKRASDIAPLAVLQARMIARAVDLLKPGGVLVYCTCSLEKEEGEDHLAAALATLPVSLVPIDSSEVGGLTEVVARNGTLRTLPCHLPQASPRLSGLDGFFAMRLKRA